MKSDMEEEQMEPAAEEAVEAPAEEQTESMGMKPEDSEAAKKVVLGCMKLMFDKATHQHLVDGMQGPAPMPEKLARNVVGVMKMFAGRAQGQIPRQVLIPAATMLVMELAEFVAKSGLGKPTGADVKAAVGLVVKLVKEAFPAGGTPPAQPAAQPPAPPQPPMQQPAPQPGLIAGA